MRLDLDMLRGLAWGLAAGMLLTLATQCEWGRRADGEVDGELRQLAHVTDAAIARQHHAAVIVRQRTAAVAAAHRASGSALDRARTLHALVRVASPTTLRVEVPATGAVPARETLLVVPPVVVARVVADSLAIDSLTNEVLQHEGLEEAFAVMRDADSTRIAAQAETIEVLERTKRSRCGAKCGAVLTVGALVVGGIVAHHGADLVRAIGALLHGKPP